jgi:hypothetical protein
VAVAVAVAGLGVGPSASAAANGDVLAHPLASSASSAVIASNGNSASPGAPGPAHAATRGFPAPMGSPAFRPADFPVHQPRRLGTTRLIGQ